MMLPKNPIEPEVFWNEFRWNYPAHELEPNTEEYPVDDQGKVSRRLAIFRDFVSTMGFFVKFSLDQTPARFVPIVPEQTDEEPLSR